MVLQSYNKDMLSYDGFNIVNENEADSSEAQIVFRVQNHIDELMQDHIDEYGKLPTTVYIPDVEEEQSLYMYFLHLKNIDFVLYDKEDFSCD